MVLTEKVIFEQRFEGDEISHRAIWARVLPEGTTGAKVCGRVSFVRPEATGPGWRERERERELELERERVLGDEVQGMSQNERLCFYLIECGAMAEFWAEQWEI